VTAGAGVTAQDNAQILTVLETTRSAIVFAGNQPTAPPTAPTAGGGASLIFNITCGSGALACGSGMALFLSLLCFLL
jgi:hypothetical protein